MDSVLGLINEISESKVQHITDNQKTKVSNKDPVFVPRSQENSERVTRLREKGWKVKYKKGVKLTTIIRFLISKLLYEEEGLSLDGYIVLVESLTRALENPDPSFQTKWKDWLIPAFELVCEIGSQGIFPIILSPLGKSAIKTRLQPNLPNPQGYFGMKRSPRGIEGSYYLKINNPALLQPKIPPVRFMGVGYKDKGSRRDPAFDGRFSWQYYARGSGGDFSSEPFVESFNNLDSLFEEDW